MPPPSLKDRELEILQLLAEEKSDRAIASRLNLAAETVRWYNKQIYAKLGVSSRSEAVRRAAALGLIGAPLLSRARTVVRSPIRYVNNEGVSIAWQEIGRGPVDLLFIAGFVSHIDLLWENAEFTSFTEELARHARVIVFDRRGVGLSDRSFGASSIDNTISDARAVMRAAGSTRAYVSGTSESGAAAVLLASMHPELVRALILIAATAMPARHGDEPAWSRPWAQFEALVEAMVRTWGEPWAIERLAPSRKGDADFEAWWARTLRAAASPASVRLILERTMQVDIRALLPQVRTRTLVIHRTGDQAVNVGAGRYLAEQMPNASLLELSGNDHVWFVNGTDIAGAMIRFIREPEATPDVDTWIAIVLHAAGPGAALDDEKREIIDTFQPRNVRVTPGGWTALFDAPNRAIRCALRLRGLGRGRAGGMVLHVGACRTADGTPVGPVHAVAFRLVASAEAGEILVSGTLRDLLAGSDVVLRPRNVDGGDAVTQPATVWSLADG
jgi:pimeloyl-ACP methyl ester carboxylesterase/DNA-binding CsgD family transcriptional regulator